MTTSIRSNADGSSEFLVNGTSRLKINSDGSLAAAFPTHFRNRLINGGFDIWQRATSQTATGYGSDDRWQNSFSGSTVTHSQQLFTLGQTDVPNNPTYFSRTVVTSVAGAGNYSQKTQYIENVSTLSGSQATLSFYAKADAAKNIAVEIVQSFGTGGTPSATAAGIGSQLVSLTTVWKRYSVTVTIPSMSGATLGTNGNDYLGLYFWFDAGSNFSARSANLGQQSGTFDIANVQLEGGSVATDFEKRPKGIELGLCLRYFQRNAVRSVVVQSNYIGIRVPRSIVMRVAPSISFKDDAGGVSQFTVMGTNGYGISGGGLPGSNTEIVVDVLVTPTPAAGATWWSTTIDSSAEL